VALSTGISIALILWGAVVTVLVISAMEWLRQLHDSVSGGGRGHPGGLTVGTAAPRVHSLGPEGTGSITFGDGQRWLLTFVSPGCRPCAVLLHAWAETAAAFSSIGITPVLIHYRSRAEATGREGSTELVDGEGATFQNFRIHATPFFYVIGGDGRILKSGVADARTLAQVATEV
jgi:hypothetical protein